jgi:hypothetical protein
MTDKGTGTRLVPDIFFTSGYYHIDGHKILTYKYAVSYSSFNAVFTAYYSAFSSNI